MTEADWDSCTDPQAMLEFLQGKAGDRKLRLLAVACFRGLLALLPDPRQRRGVDALEELAEGTISPAARRRAATDVRHAMPPWPDRTAGTPQDDTSHFVGLMLYREFCSSSIADHAIHAAVAVGDGSHEQCTPGDFFRCLVGNPFRVVALDPAWRTPTVLSLAFAAYDERSMPSGHLDPARLSILADALEDASCTDAELLGHLRGDTAHWRGCWAIDLLVGRE